MVKWLEYQTVSMSNEEKIFFFKKTQSYTFPEFFFLKISLKICIFFHKTFFYQKYLIYSHLSSIFGPIKEPIESKKLWSVFLI